MKLKSLALPFLEHYFRNPIPIPNTTAYTGRVHWSVRL